MNEDIVRLWPFAERILDDVLDLPEPERTSRAIAACHGDAALEAAVRRLLQADGAESGFLGALPESLLDDGAAEAATLARIGPFRIVRELGRGGMGTVMLGERDDGAYEQRVAIKLLHESFATSEAADALVRERRILARLEHPAIARMYDGGVTEGGAPYFVMEYVDGEPLDAYCDARTLTIAQRLDLFRQVCSAVEYAHGRLVVHCDIKPRNVLVTSAGQVKLLDFGIARILEAEGAAPSRTGARVFTPAYAAPEQARGEAVTAATDVYQLGLVLYEILTGRRTEAGPTSTLVPANGAAKLRGTREATLARELHGDLEAITMKALRPDPAERYPTAEALRRDLDDYLERRPVSARRATTAYRLRKYLSRHRFGVTAAAAILTTLVAGLIGVSAQSRVAAEERDRARLAELRASAVNDFVLHELLRAPMPESALGRELTVSEALANAARSVGHAFRGDPLTEAEVRLAVARTYAALGHNEEANLQAQAAYGILARDPSSTPAALQGAERMLGKIACDAGRYAKSREALEALYAKQREASGPDDAETLRTAAALGTTLNALGEYVRAENVLRAGIEAARREHPDLWRLRVDLARPLVRSLNQQLEGLEAATLSRETLDTLEEHVGPDHPDRINALLDLTNSLVTQLKYAEAADVADQAVALSQRVYGDRHPATADALYTQALNLERLGRYPEAIAAQREALAIGRRAVGSEHPKTFYYLLGLGMLLRNDGRIDDAEPMIRAAAEGRARVLGDPHPDTIRALSSWQMLLLALHRDAEARALAHRIVRAFEAATAPEDASFRIVDEFAQQLLYVEPEDVQDPARALALAERAVALSARRAYPPLSTLADALVRAGRKDEAIAAYQELLRLPDGMRSWSSEEHVVELLEEQGRTAAVEAFFADRLATQRATPGADRRMIAKSLRVRGRWQLSKERAVEAEASYREAIAIQKQVLPADNWEIGRTVSELGGCLIAQQRYADAEELLLEGQRIVEADGHAARAVASGKRRLVTLYEAWGRPADAARWR